MNIARTFDSLLLKLLRSWLNILSLIKSIGRKGERMANPALGIGICFKYKTQNKLSVNYKTFCTDFTSINIKQNVNLEYKNKYFYICN